MSLEKENNPINLSTQKLSKIKNKLTNDKIKDSEQILLNKTYQKITELESKTSDLFKKLKLKKQKTNLIIENIITNKVVEYIKTNNIQITKYFTERIKYIAKDVEKNEKKETKKITEKYLNVLEDIKNLKDENKELSVKKEYYKNKFNENKIL
ncbi:hypothetical protein GVAV_001579 [Gurleya vavrai]